MSKFLALRLGRVDILMSTIWQTFGESGKDWGAEVVESASKVARFVSYPQ